MKIATSLKENVVNSQEFDSEVPARTLIEEHDARAKLLEAQRPLQPWLNEEVMAKRASDHSGHVA